MASFSSSDDDGDVEWNAKSSNKTKSNSKKKKIKKAKVEEEEKEEGEIEDDQFDDGYDDNLMGDEEDQRRLAQLTEKEREQELFNRSEKREVLRTRFEIERKLRLAKKKELEKKQEQKRQRLRAQDIYSDSDDDSSSDEDSSPVHYHHNNDHHSTPAATVNTASKNSVTNTSSNGGLSNDDDSHDDNDSDDEQSDREDEEEVEEFDITLNDLKSIQLKRDQVEEWCHAPFFKNTAIGLFVKISIGNNPQTKGHVYKVAQILDITKSPRAYNLGKTKTDKAAFIKYGKNERSFQMLYISNSPFDENDLLRWKESMQNDNCDQPSKEHFLRKRMDLKKAIEYEYRDEDIEAMLAEKNRFKETPYNFAMRKTQLIAQKADAELAGDHELAMKIQQDIDLVEEKAKQQEKSRSSSTFSAISFVNERNRLRNIAEAEKVLMESKNVKTEDPFTRRKCTPTIVHKFSKNMLTSNTPQGNTPSTTPNDSSYQTKKDISDGRNPNGSTPLKTATDLFAAHDDIELDLDLGI